MDKLLKLLEQNARFSEAELALMLDISENEVSKKIDEYESNGTIRGYKAIFDREKIIDEKVSAFIEIKVQPKLGQGFDDIATRIAQLDEVETLYLMSGGFDLAVVITGKTFQEVAMFVAKRLSPLDSVVSTATHFMLKTYKDSGVMVNSPLSDDRRKISL